MLSGRWAAVVGAAALATLLPAPSAVADGKGAAGSCGESFFCVHAESDGQAAQQAPPRARHKASGKSAKPHVCQVVRLSPQPPADSPLWEGHKPGKGAIYVRSCVYTAGADLGGIGIGAGLGAPFWSPRQPAPTTVDPAVLAQRAVDRMRLSGPDIQTPRADRRYLVGMPMWMHLGQSPTTFGPNSATAAAGAVTVTATARVASVTWSMGDGAEAVTCRGPGTVYRPSYGKRMSPDCGYVYPRGSDGEVGGRFTVTATAHWVIDWQGAGQQGQFTQTRSSQVRTAVAELQALG